jgi:hypothetical protein
MVVGCVASFGGTATATDVSQHDVERLAAASATNTASREALRAITSIDGAPVDMAALLDGAADGEVARRVEALTAVLDGASANAASAGARARAILASKEYTERDFPKPVRRPVEWVGDRLRAFWHWLDLSLPGGAWVVWVVVGGLVALAVAIATTSVVRRRVAGGALLTVRTNVDVDGAPTARQLDSLAETAERHGDLRAALRLRFQAGLTRLGASHVIDSPDTATGDQLARRLRSGRFDRLRRTFDEVIYGGRAATAADLTEARTEWPHVTAEARRS